MRLEITRRAELAVRALSLLGTSTDRMKASALAAGLGTTPAFVPQIVAPLVKAGWVVSDPGPTGGYSATVATQDLNVLQVIEAVEGETDVGRCVVADRPCLASGPCILHDAWTRARTELLDVLRGIPLSGVGSGGS